MQQFVAAPDRREHDLAGHRSDGGFFAASVRAQFSTATATSTTTFRRLGSDAANYVAVLQAELRAIASRLVMPEFMLSSDASSSNYASTMVAEKPGDSHVRPFASRADQRRSASQMWRVLSDAVATGRLPSEALTDVEIQATGPSLEVRDPLKEAETYRIEFESGILSPQTWSQRSGLDYDQEQMNLREHAAHAAQSDATNAVPSDTTNDATNAQ